MKTILVIPSHSQWRDKNESQAPQRPGRIRGEGRGGESWEGAKCGGAYVPKVSLPKSVANRVRVHMVSIFLSRSFLELLLILSLFLYLGMDQFGRF